MQTLIIWTEKKDSAIKDMRVCRMSWDAIAETVGTTRIEAKQRGAEIGALMNLTISDDANPEREALCSGHPMTWGSIIAGTCMAGAAYPVQVRA